MVTIANLAKFISESVFIVHFHMWRLWLRFKNRKRTATEREAGQQIFNDTVNEQVLLGYTKCQKNVWTYLRKFWIKYDWFVFLQLQYLCLL